MPEASAAFEQAIALVPEYANAKYFLGLSYAATSRFEAAAALFEDLARSNPDNAEVSLILANLRERRAPFEGLEPPPTPPEERATAPVSE
jgi:cytochrome c-type biogenesis protein CcmH/NrfG